MSTFTDNFERGDGGLGNNWTVHTGTAAIASGKVYTGTASRCSNPAVSATGRQEAILTVVYAANADLVTGPVIKLNSAGTSGYYVSGSNTLAAPLWTIYRLTNGTPTTLRSVSGSGVSAGTHTIRLLYNAGLLTLWVDGAFIQAISDNTHDALTGGGFHSNTGLTVVDAITIYSDESTSFSVTPTVVGNYGGATAMTFAGVGTSWTTGTPGSPTFTVDHGSLSSQEVTGAGSATAIYTPGAFLGTATFIDPSTGASDTVEVTSDPGTVPPDYIPLSQEAIDYIERSAVAETNPTIANREMNIATSGPSITLTNGLNTVRLSVSDSSITGYEVPDNSTLVQILMEIWRGLNGTLIFGGATLVPDHNDSVKIDTDTLRTSMEELRGVLDWTLPGILNVIVGEDSISTTHLHDDIAAISAGSNQDVLDALAAYFGQNPPTIQQLGTMVSDIATIAGYTLGDVLDAIADIPGVDLSTITTKLDAIQPSETFNLSTITTQASGANTGAAAAVVALDLLTGDGALTLQTVLDAIAALEPGPPGGATAPVWPGIDNVTLGTPVALSHGLVVTEEMDGVIVAVTTPPTRTGLYQIGDQYYDYGVGRIAFESDGGELEPWQYLGFRAALFTPKSMVRASACHLQVLGGAEGTITPWTVS